MPRYVLCRLGLALAPAMLCEVLPAQLEVCSSSGQANDQLGTAVGGVAGAAGMGYALLGAPNGTAFVPNTGTVTIRNASCVSPAPPFFLPVSGGATGDRYGAAIAEAGGNQFLIGAPGYDGPAGTDAGAAVLVDATTGGMVRLFAGPAAGDNAGHSVSAAGDVDGDGATDYLVGAPSAFTFRCTTGSAGPGDVVRGGVHVFSGAPGSPLLMSIVGSSCCSLSCRFGEGLGTALSPLDDADGDGVDDFLVGSHTVDEVHLYGYDASVPGPKLIRTDQGPAKFGFAVVALDDIDGDGVRDYAAGAPGATPEMQVRSGASGTLLRSWTGVAGEFGAALANAGDQDGGGQADLLIGAPGANANAGAALVYSTETGHLLGVMHGDAAGDRLGASVASVPDMNGDGRRELAVGAPGANMGAGRARVMTLGCSNLARASCVGTGCAPAGTLMVEPQLGTPNGAPRPGFASFSASVAHTVVGSQAFLFAGASRLASPFCLAFAGLPSCCLHVLPALPALPAPTRSWTSSVQPGLGFARVPMPLPSSLQAGQVIHLQWYLFDPGPAPVPATMSRALQLTLAP